MAIKSPLKMGNPQLLQPSHPITEFGTPELAQIVQDMSDTMEEKGGVGIAAPQIGYLQRVILFGFEKSVRYPKEKPVPLTLLINPTFTILSEEMLEDWEGCLSVPGLRGLVPRYNKIHYSGFDLTGNVISREVEGFHARIIQHECDHLDGILFPRRIKDLRYFGFEDELVWNK